MRKIFIALCLAASLCSGNAMAMNAASADSASQQRKADINNLKHALLASDICGFDFSSQENAIAFAERLGVDEVISSSGPYHLGLSGALESLGDASSLTAPPLKKLPTLLKKAGVKQIFFKNEAAAKKFKKAAKVGNNCAINTPVCIAV